MTKPCGGSYGVIMEGCSFHGVQDIQNIDNDIFYA